MFLVFTAAVLVVTFAVCILAIVGSWWMLGVAMVVHVGVTAAVIRVLVAAFGPETDRYPDIEPVTVGAKATVAAPSVKPMARPTSLLPHH